MKHSLLISKVRLRGNLNGSLFNFEGPGGDFREERETSLLFGWRSGKLPERMQGKG